MDGPLRVTTVVPNLGWSLRADAMTFRKEPSSYDDLTNGVPRIDEHRLPSSQHNVVEQQRHEDTGIRGVAVDQGRQRGVDADGLTLDVAGVQERPSAPCRRSVRLPLGSRGCALELLESVGQLLAAHG